MKIATSKCVYIVVYISRNCERKESFFFFLNDLFLLNQSCLTYNWIAYFMNAVNFEFFFQFQICIYGSFSYQLCNIPINKNDLQNLLQNKIHDRCFSYLINIHLDVETGIAIYIKLKRCFVYLLSIINLMSILCTIWLFILNYQLNQFVNIFFFY